MLHLEEVHEEGDTEDQDRQQHQEEHQHQVQDDDEQERAEARLVGKQEGAFVEATVVVGCAAVVERLLDSHDIAEKFDVAERPSPDLVVNQPIEVVPMARVSMGIVWPVRTAALGVRERDLLPEGSFLARAPSRRLRA